MISFKEKDSYNIDDLLKIMEILRSQNGCPWDMEQTHTSIREDFIEEVYEAVEAIDLNDIDLLREELGDVLLQVVFHCQIEKEKNNFSFNNICNELCNKLILRHPHVFGNVSADNSQEVLKNWDSIKKESKGQASYSETLESVAKSLPALMRAQKVGKRAMRAGMDFKSTEDAFSCIEAETLELKNAMESGNIDDIEDEFGDLLFSCVNTARHIGIDSETAMTKATDKFIRRFYETEKLVRLNGMEMNSLSIDELDVYWRQAKISAKLNDMESKEKNGGTEK